MRFKYVLLGGVSSAAAFAATRTGITTDAVLVGLVIFSAGLLLTQLAAALIAVALEVYDPQLPIGLPRLTSVAIGIAVVLSILGPPR